MILLVETFELARTEKHTAGAFSAVMGIAKLHGLLVEKREITGKITIARPRLR
jgi:hypothetical protein